MQIKNLVIDPSFFVKPEKLKIISKLERSIAEFELIKQDTARTDSLIQAMEITTNFGTQTSHSGSRSSTNILTGFSEEEVSKFKPKIILPNILKAIDPLGIKNGDEADDQLVNNSDLRELFKNWGLKKEIIKNEEAYRDFIHELPKNKLIIKFFDERRERIEWLEDPKLEDKIGQNTLHYRDILKMLTKYGRIVHQTLWQMLKKCYNKTDTVVASCNTKFRKLAEKIGIVRIKLVGYGLGAGSTATKLYHFSYGIEATEFLQSLGLNEVLIPGIIDGVVVASMGFPFLSTIMNSARFADTLRTYRQEFNRRFKEDGGLSELNWNLKPTSRFPNLK